MQSGRKIAGLTAIVALAGLVVAAFFIEEPLRRWMEREINRPLDGYSVQIGGLDLHPLTFSLSLERVIVRQDAVPEPPIASVARIHGGIEWRALLSLALVARIRVEQPIAHIDLAQLRAEAADPRPLSQIGWQEAIANVTPIEINEIRVVGGEVTYRDVPSAKPIQIEALNARASNIRNVRSERGTYPSPIHLEARLLGPAVIEIDGAANFLAEPHAEGRADFALKDAPLERLAPAAKHFGLAFRGGRVAANGSIESTSSTVRVALQRVTLDGVDADYVERSTAPTAEKEAAKAVAKTATKTVTAAATKSNVVVELDALEVRKSTLGFVNATVDPHYRLFVNVSTASLRDFSNGQRNKDAPLALDGTFMGSGSLRLRGTIRPDRQGPDLDLALQMEGTEIKTLNDLLRAHGRLDVVAGELSIYSEVAVRDGAVTGYVKPLFVGLDVYDRAQDRDNSLLNEVYQGAVGAVATVLQNQPLDQVATVTPIAGSLDAVDPDAWRSFVLLLRNAFIEAIRPGLERSVAG